MSDVFFYVCHGGEVGDGSEMFFAKAAAFASQQTYIDVFDSDGQWVDAYKLNDDEVTYTKDF